MSSQTRHIFLIFSTLFKCVFHTAVLAADVVFYGAGDSCWGGLDHVGCYSASEQECCNSIAPFCVSFSLADTDTGNYTLYASGVQQCDVNSDPHDRAICTQAGAGHADCCVELPLGEGQASCSAFWYDNGKNEAAERGTRAGRRCAEPNMMAYTHAPTGELRRIAVPRGMFAETAARYMASDWGALGDYERWVR